MDHGSKIHEVATCCNKPLFTRVSYAKSLTSEGTLKLSLWNETLPQISAFSHPRLGTEPTGQFGTSSGGSTRRFQFVSSNLSCFFSVWPETSLALQAAWPTCFFCMLPPQGLNPFKSFQILPFFRTNRSTHQRYVVAGGGGETLFTEYIRIQWNWIHFLMATWIENVRIL